MNKTIVVWTGLVFNILNILGIIITYIAAPEAAKPTIIKVGVLFVAAVCAGSYLLLSFLLLRGKSSSADDSRKDDATKRSPEIRVLATSLVYDGNNPAIRYPLKMNIEMRNDSSECIDVRLAGYTPVTKGIGELKKFVTAVLRLNCSGKLFPPVDGESRIAVLHGQQFHAWLGFDEKKATKEQLEQHLGKIGTLALIVNGKTVNLPV